MYYLTPNADRSGDWMLPYITIEGSGCVLCMLCTGAVLCHCVSPVIAKTHVLSDPNAYRSGDWMLPYITIEGCVLCAVRVLFLNHGVVLLQTLFTLQ
jgi:ferredoxin